MTTSNEIKIAKLYVNKITHARMHTYTHRERESVRGRWRYRKCNGCISLKMVANCVYIGIINTACETVCDWKNALLLHQHANAATILTVYRFIRTNYAKNDIWYFGHWKCAKIYWYKEFHSFNSFSVSFKQQQQMNMNDIDWRRVHSFLGN